MGLAGSDNQRNVEAIALLALFLSFSTFSLYNLTNKPVACFPGDIGTVKCPITTNVSHDTISLGTWTGMPFNSTELMGNESYRATLTFNAVNVEAGITTSLSVGCITPSNTVGASLQLQYANFSTTTNLNTSNFVNVGTGTQGQVFIDNSANWACPGTLVSPTSTSLPAGGGLQGFIFRAVGSGGGGTGDNPRFSSVTVNVLETVARTVVFYATSITTTGFSANLRQTLPAAVSTTVNFQWIATTNGALTESGSGSCTINVNAVSCNALQTFGTSFVGTPQVVGNGQTSTTISLAVASLNLLKAQTVTV